MRRAAWRRQGIKSRWLTCGSWRRWLGIWRRCLMLFLVGIMIGLVMGVGITSIVALARCNDCRAATSEAYSAQVEALRNLRREVTAQVAEAEKSAASRYRAPDDAAA